MNFDYKGIMGFDISRWQDDPTTPVKNNFEKMKSYGASFCISKAGQYNFKDINFSDNWKGTKEGGLARGSYWFCDKRSSGKQQAQLYWSILQGNGYENEMCFADYESGAWDSWKELYNFIFEFQRISQLPFEKIGIYTAYYFWMEHMPFWSYQRDFFHQYPLWLAYYTNDVSFVKVPSPWKESDVLIWQSGTPSIGHEVGVESKEIDYNEFQGDENKFEKYFGKTIDIPPVVEPSQPDMELILRYGDFSVSYKKA